MPFKNIEQRRKYERMYHARQTPAYRKAKSIHNMAWKKAHPEANAHHRRTWLNKNPAARCADRLRARINCALTRGYHTKTASSKNLIGCSWDEFKTYIEGKFLPGMTWLNRHHWHIDHIKPVCRFDLSTLEGQQAAFHYTNTQPLWAEDNLQKADSYEE